MTQQRIWNYGDTFTAEKIKQAQGALNCSGVYSNYNISVYDVNKLSLSANGFLLQPNGILITETGAVILTLNTLPSLATTYTITCRHTDVNQLGGAEAVYDIEEGNFAVGSLSDGVVLGWIYHPGSAVPFDLSFIEEAPKNGCDIPAHASTHYASGTDPIEIASLGTSETDTDYVLHPDGSGGIEWGPEVGGECDPCSLDYLILKTDGGVVVDDSGEIVVKTEP